MAFRRPTRDSGDLELKGRDAPLESSVRGGLGPMRSLGTHGRGRAGRGVFELPDGPDLDLADPLTSDAQPLADLLERQRGLAHQAEPEADHRPFPFVEAL